MSWITEDRSKMNDTLEPIRPSNSSVPDEISYLYSRDPSILAYGQRPGVSAAQKKNLMSLYEEDSTFEIHPTLNSSSIQTIKVFLRLKPFPRKKILNEQELKAYFITDSTTLLTKIPSQDYACNATLRGHSSISETVCRTYTFTETFGPETTQKGFFERVVKLNMQDFLTGSNATIMAYGTTNSGKTFTLQGTTSSPGLIPRSLEYVFAQITPKILPSYKPVQNNTVVALSAIDIAQELEIKNKLLAFNTADRNQYISSYKEMQKLLEAECPKRENSPTDAQYAVWVSFAEIYNETIYDLLSNDVQKNRPALKLGTDSNGIAYIKGLKFIFVNSGSEAFQILMAGQYNLKVAATALNARSSRSHCIFTIKLLKFYRDHDPDSVEVSTFSFCDLAGSERQAKTLNVGVRLKEAQSINTSLLVLGRCLKSIYEGQTSKHRNEHFGPFRESKLTRLFQKPLSGKEPISLVVNVNPMPNLYAETQNVLNFAAIAKKIVVQPKKSKPRRSKTRFSRVISQTSKAVIEWNDTIKLDNISEEPLSDDELSDSIMPEDYEDLLIQNAKLQKEIEQLKASATIKELETRDEMARLHREMVEKLEQDYVNRLEDVKEEQENLREWEIEKIERYYQEKLNEKSSKKRKRTDMDDLDDQSNVVELEGLNSRIASLREKLKAVRKEKNSAILENNKLLSELIFVKEQLKITEKLKNSMAENFAGDKDSSTVIRELEEQLSNKDKHNKYLTDRLNEATQDYKEMEKELKEKDKQIENLSGKIINKNEEITDLQNNLDNVNYIMDNMEEDIAKAERKIGLQKQQLIESEERYAKLKELFEEKNNEIVVEVKDDSDDKAKQISRLQEDLTKYIDENKLLNDKLCHSLEEVQLLTENLARIKNDNEELFEKYTKLEKLMKGTQLTLKPNIIKTEPIECTENSMQTSICSIIDHSVQTSLLQSSEDKMLQTSLNFTEIEVQLEKSKNEYDKLAAKHQEKESLIKELKNQINDLTTIIQEKNQVDECLQQSKDIQHKLEIERIELENRLRENEESYFTQLKQLKNEIEICRNEHLPNIDKLTNEIENCQTVNVDQQKKVNDYEQRINELDKKLIDMRNVNEKQIAELTKKIQDKDDEILKLQQEVKRMIKLNAHEDVTKDIEDQWKETLKELSDTKSNLKNTDDLNKNLQTKVLNLESTISRLKLELSELKKLNEKFISDIDKKEQELDKFKENREKIMTDYEGMVEKLQFDLSAAKVEITNLQGKLEKFKNVKKYTRASSDDRVHQKTKVTKCGRDKEDTTDDEKRATRSTVKNQITEISTERKRRPRRKLYTHEDSCESIEIPEVSKFVLNAPGQLCKVLDPVIDRYPIIDISKIITKLCVTNMVCVNKSKLIHTLQPFNNSKIEKCSLKKSY